MGFVQTIRISDDGPFADKACSACPTWAQISSIAQKNPGSVWFVGNEPDRQDYVYANHYAQLYHDFYTFLKTEDPTCQVGIGGVVQTTPIRLEYLDLILGAYQSQYGKAMPIDVWNVHHYLLREATDYGGGLPPGTDTNKAILYGIQEHDLLDPHPNDPQKLGWKGHLVEMRRWMRDRGYRDRPLIITEFGILMPEIYGYNYTRVRDFLLATFDWMMTATDPEIGYPADGNRLVQAWAWYSLNDPAFEGFTSWNHLFDPETRSITPLGLDYGKYTEPLASTPLPSTIDLQPVAIWNTMSELESSTPVTVTVSAQVRNNGTETAHNVLVHFERGGVPAGQSTIPSIAGGQSQAASVTWTNLSVGQVYQASATVVADAQTIECNPFNNKFSMPMVIAAFRNYLPLVQKHH
jgi:hypothetical protein